MQCWSLFCFSDHSSPGQTQLHFPSSVRLAWSHESFIPTGKTKTELHCLLRKTIFSFCCFCLLTRKRWKIFGERRERRRIYPQIYLLMQCMWILQKDNIKISFKIRVLISVEAEQPKMFEWFLTASTCCEQFLRPPSSVALFSQCNEEIVTTMTMAMTRTMAEVSHMGCSA